MSYRLSRRSLLAAGSAAGALPLLASRAVASAPPTSGDHRLIAGTRTLEVNGRAARVFRLTNETGRPGLTLAPGERFRVALTNQLQDHTIIHWHGQLPPWTQDGFPWSQTPPLAPASSKNYDYAPISGTYWMHSHHGLQEQNLMTAPLIIQSAAESREDRQEVVLMLNDFSFRAPDELLAGLTGQSPAAIQAMAREVENVPPPAMGQPPITSSMGTMRAASGMGGAIASGQMGGMSMGGMSGMGMDVNDVSYDAFLANDHTLADPEIVRVGGRGRVRLRIINSASSSQFWIDLSSLTGRVVAVDGHAVHPVAGSRFPLAIAQRLDILIDLPGSGAFPILARLEGSRRRTGFVLATKGARITRIEQSGLDQMQPIDNSLEMRLSAAEPLTPRKPDLVHQFTLGGGMKPYSWSLNGEYWPRITPLMLVKGQRVEIELVNHTTMAHPMHLHGHAFQVIAVNGKSINGAVRDTVLVMPKMAVRIAFDADNPGRWPFHCHNLYHMMTGMMTEFRYQGISV